MRNKSIYGYVVVLLLITAIIMGVLHSRKTSTPQAFFLTVDTQLSKSVNLSSNDLHHLEVLSNDNNASVRAHALTSLSYVKKQQDKELAIKAARSHIADKDWLVRNAALNVLRRTNAVDLDDVAHQLLSDPAPEVRKEAQRILSRHATASRNIDAFA